MTTYRFLFYCQKNDTEYKLNNPIKLEKQKLFQYPIIIIFVSVFFTSKYSDLVKPILEIAVILSIAYIGVLVIILINPSKLGKCGEISEIMSYYVPLFS